LCTLLHVSYVHSETIHIAVLEFCPFVCNPDKNEGKPGFSVELERTILERAGYTAQFHYVPYLRSIIGTEEGRYDAVGFCNDHSSTQNICSSETVGPMKQVFYVQKGNPWRYSGLDSLDNVKIGVIGGYNYNTVSPEFQQYLETNKNNRDRVEYKFGDDVLHRLLKQVVLGRIDTTNESEYVADYIAKKKGLFNQLEKAGSFESPIIWGRICFSAKKPNAEQLVEIIDQGIKKMKDNGELNTILKKYDLEYWD
jgi:polar amino acid transport system substrate-binding protein